MSVFPKRGGHLLSYWHVVPAVVKDQRVRRHQLIGHVVVGAEHVHLAEYKDGTYVNPLRLGGLAPYIDDTVPQIPSLTFHSSGQPIPPEGVTGTVDITAEAFDTPPVPLPLPWNQVIYTPSVIRWRIVQGQNTVRQWETPVDFRSFLLPLNLFNFVYAPGTFQNKAGRRGRYEFYLAHSSTRACWRTAPTSSRSTRSTSRRTSARRRSRSRSRTRAEPVEVEPRVGVDLRQVERKVEPALRDHDPLCVVATRDRDATAVQELDHVVAPLVRIVVLRVGDVRRGCGRDVDGRVRLDPVARLEVREDGVTGRHGRA